MFVSYVLIRGDIAINIPRFIYLYDEGPGGFDFSEIKRFIVDNFGKIPVRLIRMKEKAVVTNGLLFDFIGTRDAFSQRLESTDQGTCHIILTDRLFATLDADMRPHIRAAVFSFPSVISTSGIVEGPAKPRQFYFYKQRYTQLGIWDIEEAQVKKKFKGRFIDYHDKRLPEVIKGYISQALFFYMTAEPFCNKKSCRLYNAHWQEDLIYAQIKQSGFCRRHSALLEKIRTS